MFAVFLPWKTQRLTRGAAIYALIGNDEIRAYIPGHAFECGNTLQFVCKTEQHGSAYASCALPEGESSIVVTATHAESVTMIIKAEQWHDDQVKMSRR